MLRAFVVVLVSLSITACGQEAVRGEYVAFNSASADLESAGASSSSEMAPRALAPESAATTEISSSRSILQPAAVQVSNPATTQHAILSTAANVPYRPSVKQQRTWWALTIAQHSAATFDAWSTRQSISSGNGYERNPLMKPFAGSSAIYPVIQVLPLGLDYVSNRMMRSRHGFLRKTWWLPQTLATAGFVWSGANNMRIAAQR